MHSYYVSEHQNPASLRIYRDELKKTGLKFKAPQLDICHKCDTYEAKLKYETDENARIELNKFKETHQDSADG